MIGPRRFRKFVDVMAGRVKTRSLLLVTAIFITSGALEGEAAIPKTVTLRNFFGEGFTLERPVAISEMPGHDSVFVVTEQSGKVTLVRSVNGEWVKSVFDSVGVSGVNAGGSGDDGGLLGFAFHPNFTMNGRYYLYYVAAESVRPRPGRLLLEERRTDSTLFARDKTLAPRLVLSLDKPFVWHNGGTLKFGPDGYLYTAIGDGGSSGDPENRAQARDSLWGKFIRIIPDGVDAYPDDPTRNYGIPADNPFVNQTGTLPEIWAYGLRSPWKWDWNPFTGAIWLGDIGQARYEEITTVPRGANLGWKIREGAFCYSPSTGCTQTGLTPPVFTFPSRGFGQSVTGGTFFIGDTNAALHGVYFYGDFHHNRLYALRPNAAGTGWVDTATLVDPVMNLVSLDKDRRGNILAVSMAATSGITDNTGAVYILESPDLRLEPAPVRLARARRALSPGRPISSADLRRNPAGYLVRDLQGRVILGVPHGTFWVVEKGTQNGAQLMTIVAP
jgi:glucose/arabinose dehydrogenase